LPTLEVRPAIQRAAEGARANGTPFISFFTPVEMLKLARDAGFKEVQHVSAAALAQRYFAGRADGLRPPNNSRGTAGSDDLKPSGRSLWVRAPLPSFAHRRFHAI
jgi:hypothetical protein